MTAKKKLQSNVRNSQLNAYEIIGPLDNQYDFFSGASYSCFTIFFKTFTLQHVCTDKNSWYRCIGIEVGVGRGLGGIQFFWTTRLFTRLVEWEYILEMVRRSRG